MKTLRYRLSGRPRNLDDCLDLVRKGRPARARLHLRIARTVSEMFVREEFLGEYLLEFPDRHCRWRDFCGAFFLCEPAPKRARQLRRANERLARRLKSLEDAGVVVAGRDSRFDASCPSA